MDSSPTRSATVENAVPHWFYSSSKTHWLPFSSNDSRKLEISFNSGTKNADVFGCRFQADLDTLSLKPIYWETEEITSIRRSWWNYSNQAHECVPLSQSECDIVETAYLNSVATDSWPAVINLPDIGRVILENATLFKLLFTEELGPIDRIGDMPDQSDSMKTEQILIASLSVGTPLRRGFGSDFYANLSPGEPDSFDHLVLVVHGIGGYCDLRFRSLPDCVNDMRQLTQRLCLDHSIIVPSRSAESSADAASSSKAAQNSIMDNNSSIEFLPVQWHSALHKGPDGLNEKLNRISLESCGKIRNFVNDVLLDVLLFTSPVYHQAIVENVVSEINRVYSLFHSRHPSFKGRVSLIGHSLGSVIVFDILANQTRLPSHVSASSTESRMLLGPCHLHNAQVKTELAFSPFIFFAVGSPLSMFLTVSGVNSVPSDYALPTCQFLYNIFHPFDPVAYRIEPLIQQPSSSSNQNAPPPPVVMPHHRGRKRLHLEVKDVMQKIGDDIRRRVVESLQSVAVFFKRTRSSSNMMEQVAEMTGVVSDTESTADAAGAIESSGSPMPPDSVQDTSTTYSYGSLNSSQRMDYVLQETPIEVVNPYLFSIASHLCYWQSEDTCLFIARALYGPSSPSTQ